MPATATRLPKKEKKANETADQADGLFSDWENEMAKQWEPLLFSVIRNHFRSLVSGPHRDDVISEAYIGLAMAIRHHDPYRINPKTGRATQFNTYAVQVIYNQIRRWAGRHFDRQSKITFVGMPSLADERKGTVGGEFADERYTEMVAEMEDAEEARAEVARRMKKVNRRDIGILKSHLGGFTTGRKQVAAIPKRTIKRLAEVYGKTPVEIRRRILRAKSALGIEEAEREFATV